MKGLDSGALLALLEGEGSVKTVLRSWSGEEIATTELNLLELTALALSGPVRSRSGRLEALGRLRRRLTVLPIGAKSQEILVARGPKIEHGGDLVGASIYATLEGAGCNEVLVGSTSTVPVGHWKLKVRRLARSNSK